MNEVHLNEVTYGDAMSLLKEVDDNCIDLTILDPNYKDWDKLCKRGLIDQAVRVTKPTGNIICFTKQPFDFNLRNHVNKIFRREIIWSFSNGGAFSSKRMPLMSFQKIYWLTISKDFYIDVRTGLQYSPSTKVVNRKRSYSSFQREGWKFEKSNEGTWIRDHYHYNKPGNGNVHEKPKELIRTLIKCLCPENGMVLDPFFGSGITGKVANEINRNFIAFEINQGLTTS